NRYDKYFWPDYRVAAFLVNRGRESIVIPTSLLLLRWFSGRRTVLDTLLILASCAGCALTATRAPLTLVFLIVLMIMLSMGRVKGLLLMAIGLLSSYLAITALLNYNDLASGGVIESIGVAFPEVRDLAWILSRQDERYWGLTFLAGILPLPAFLSE